MAKAVDYLIELVVEHLTEKVGPRIAKVVPQIRRAELLIEKVDYLTGMVEHLLQVESQKPRLTGRYMMYHLHQKPFPVIVALYHIEVKRQS